MRVRFASSPSVTDFIQLSHHRRIEYKDTKRLGLRRRTQQESQRVECVPIPSLCSIPHLSLNAGRRIWLSYRAAHEPMVVDPTPAPINDQTSTMGSTQRFPMDLTSYPHPYALGSYEFFQRVIVVLWAFLHNLSVYLRIHQQHRVLLVCRADPPLNAIKRKLLSLFYFSRQSSLLALLLHIANLVFVSSVLEYPPFNEVIHWDGVNRVVLEQPQILESHILPPVFAVHTLDFFKRRLYVRVPYGQLNWPLIPWFYVMIGIRLRLRAS